MRKITVLDYLEYNAFHNPNKVAVIEGNTSISYAELSEITKNIACTIYKFINSKEKIPVVIFMDKGIKALTSMYGAIYSGNFYVPMDIKTPKSRLTYILSTLGDYIIITSKESEKLLLDFGYEGKYILYEDVFDSRRTALDDYNLLEVKKSVIDTDLMYIIFTSGSTGFPKGVAVRHRSVMDYIEAFLNDIGMSEDDIAGNQAPFYADMSVRELFMTMAVGATLCIIPQKFFMFPKKLLKYLDECKVTFCAWVPTAYRIVMQFCGLEKIKPRYLNRILFSGESMPVPVYNYWKNHYPKAKFIQSYGPTEITGSCTYYFVDRHYNDDEVIPIGRPFCNTGLILLDEKDNIIKNPNIVGEICVYGTCLAAGYYNNKEKTSDAFVDLPLEYGYEQKMYRTGDLAKWNDEKNLVFISRKDYQIKHMGKRIELGEIETVFFTVELIKGCCCVHNRDKDVLILYYVGDIEAKDLIIFAKSKLPPYMIPGKFIKLDFLPQLSNGKINRKLMDEVANGKDIKL